MTTDPSFQRSDSGNDQVRAPTADELAEELFEHEALKYTKPRNVQYSSMPGPPDALPKSTGASQRSAVDSGSDATGRFYYKLCG